MTDRTEARRLAEKLLQTRPMGGGFTNEMKIVCQQTIAIVDALGRLEAFVKKTPCPYCCIGEMCGDDCLPCDACGAPGDHKVHYTLMDAFEKELKGE